MITEELSRIDTANLEIIAPNIDRAWESAEISNQKYFNNAMTSILILKIREPNQYLFTFAKDKDEAKQAQHEYLAEYYPHFL